MARWIDHHSYLPGPGDDKGPPPQETGISWIIRLLFCLFMAMAVLGYKPLLQLWYEEVTKPGIWKLKVASILGSVVTIVTGVLFALAHVQMQEAFGPIASFGRILL